MHTDSERLVITGSKRHSSFQLPIIRTSKKMNFLISMDTFKPLIPMTFLYATVTNSNLAKGHSRSFSMSMGVVGILAYIYVQGASDIRNAMTARVNNDEKRANNDEEQSLWRKPDFVYHALRTASCTLLSFVVFGATVTQQMVRMAPTEKASRSLFWGSR